ncbi:hypothetical protein EXIGLDRAFT_762239, partial [Exidia glandulosa HHB12029]
MSGNLFTPPRKKRPAKLNRYQYGPSRRGTQQLEADGIIGPGPSRQPKKNKKQNGPKPREDPFLPGQPKQSRAQIQESAARAIQASGVPRANNPRLVADEDVTDNEAPPFDNEPLPQPSPHVPRYPKPAQRAPRSRKPRPEKTRVYANWTTLLPELQDPYLRRNATDGGPHRNTCTDPVCTKHIANVTCVFWDKFEKRVFRHCEHDPLAKQIVAAGLFPSAPDNPRFAFCVNLLDFYFHLFHHSADSATAAAASISAFHRERGYILRNRRGQTISEGYKRPLQFAIQWYDVLKSQVEQKAFDAVQSARQGEQNDLQAPREEN